MKKTKKAEKCKDKLIDTAAKLLDLMNGALDDCELAELITSKTMMKQFSSALKDVRDIMGLDADDREQEARIVKLEKQLGESDNEEVRVVIEGDGGGWSE